MGQSLCGFLDHVVVDQVVIVQPGAGRRGWRCLWSTRPCVWAAVVWALWHTGPGTTGPGAHAPHPERMIPMNAAAYPEEPSGCHIHWLCEPSDM